MAKNLSRVPISLRASSPEELTKLCLRNNRVNDAEFDYYMVVKDGSSWVAWFHGDMKAWAISRRLAESDAGKKASDEAKSAADKIAKGEVE